MRCPHSIPKASISTTCPTALRDVRTSTTAGRTRTRRRSSQCRFARTCLPLAARNDVESSKDAAAEPHRKTREAEAKAAAGAVRPAGRHGREAKDESRRTSRRSPSTSPRWFEAAPSSCHQAGNYTDLFAVKGKVVVRRLRAAGFGRREARSSSSISPSVRKRRPRRCKRRHVSADGNKVMPRSTRRCDRRSQACPETREADARRRDGNGGRSRAEWPPDVHRRVPVRARLLLRSAMHGVDWPAVRASTNGCSKAPSPLGRQRGPCEFIAELNASHTYNGAETSRRRRSAAPGCWASIGSSRTAPTGSGTSCGRPWDADVRAPLAEPAWTSRKATMCSGERHADRRGEGSVGAFEGWPSHVVLTVNAKPLADGARQVAVKTIADETDLASVSGSSSAGSTSTR